MAAAALSGLSAAVTGVFSRPKGITYLRHVVSALLRTQINNDNYETTDGPKQPRGPELYRTLAAKKGFEPHVVDLPEGGHGLWFGSQQASKVVLYFHGGGYALPPIDGHFAQALSLVDAAKKQNIDLAVFMLCYDLSYKAKYPTQLQQAAGSLKYLQDTHQIQNKNIILFGDSAGGNLALALLSHLAHPHPDLTPVNKQAQSSEPFCATVLYSPWIKFQYDGPSVTRNKDIDYVHPIFLDKCSSSWLKNKSEDNYTSPLRAPADWFTDLPSGDILITAGTYETLVDDIKTLAGKLKVKGQKTDLYVAEYEMHDQILIDTAIGLAPCESAKHVEKWVLQHLS